MVHAPLVTSVPRVLPTTPIIHAQMVRSQLKLELGTHLSVYHAHQAGHAPHLAVWVDLLLQVRFAKMVTNARMELMQNHALAVSMQGQISTRTVRLRRTRSRFAPQASTRMSREEARVSARQVREGISLRGGRGEQKY